MRGPGLERTPASVLNEFGYESFLQLNERKIHYFVFLANIQSEQLQEVANSASEAKSSVSSFSAYSYSLTSVVMYRERLDAYISNSAALNKHAVRFFIRKVQFHVLCDFDGALGEV